jgi:hypothetical protein
MFSVRCSRESIAKKRIRAQMSGGVDAKGRKDESRGVREVASELLASASGVAILKEVSFRHNKRIRKWRTKEPPNLSACGVGDLQTVVKAIVFGRAGGGAAQFQNLEPSAANPDEFLWL